MSPVLKIFLFVNLLAVLNIQNAVARPNEYVPNSDSPPAIGQNDDVSEEHPMQNKCQANTKYIDTCQKCAKRTKSHVVYPLCCTNTDNVYFWCNDYVYYGIQEEKKKRGINNAILKHTEPIVFQVTH